MSIVWVHSFIEPDLFDNNVPFDNTTPINMPWNLGLGLGLDLKLHYFSILHREWRKWAPYLPQISRQVTSCWKNVPIRSTTKWN